MTEREQVIRECIEYIKARPGRKVITTLEGMIKGEVATKQTKPSDNHPWRATNSIK